VGENVMAKKPPPLPEGFELESAGPANPVPQLPEGFELEGAANAPQQEPAQGDQPKGMIAAGLAGVGRGIAGMPGIVGDIQTIARKAEPYLGIKTPKNPWIQAPTSEQMIEKAAEFAPGIKYQPQTTGEKYAASVGSFLPGALIGGGGMVRNALAFGVAPGLASEAAGQMTEGTAAEPYARVAGGLVGGMAGPALSNVPGRLMSPIRQSPAIAQDVALAEHQGINSLTAGQRTGSKGLQWLEQTAMDNPLTGRNAERVAREQGEDIARATSRSTGYEAPNLRDQYFVDTQRALGDEYNALHARNAINVDQQLLGDVGTAQAEFARLTNGGQSGLVNNYVQEVGRARQGGGTIAGDVYQSLRRRIGDDIPYAASPAEGRSLTQIRDALDQSMRRSVSPEDAALWNDLDRRYSNFKVLEEAAAKRGQNIARGNVEPGAVQSAVTKRNAKGFVRGRSDLGNLAQALEAIGMKLPQSGTQPRTMAQNILNLGNLGASGTGAAAGGMMAGVPGAIAGAAIPAITSNLVMSRPVQAYLGNQAARRLGLLADVDKARRVRGLLGGGVSGAAGQRSR
jgi:hypothetical protein